MNTRALGLCAFALAAVTAIPVTSSRAGAAPSHPVRNGAIAFWGGTKIYAVQPDGSDLRVLVPAGRRNCIIQQGDQDLGFCGIRAFVWSPDGRRLAFTHGPSASYGGSLYVIGADGHNERRVVGCGHPWPSCGDPSWSPDGSHLVVSRFDGLFVVGVRDRTVRQLTRSRTDGAPRWSPDGSRIAFARSRTHKGPASSSAVYVIAAGGGHARLVPGTGQRWLWDLQWTPDGASIVFQRGDRMLEVSADGSGRPMTFVAEGVSDHPALSPDGKGLAYESARLEHQGTGRRPDYSTYRSEIWTSLAGGKRRWRVYAGTVHIRDDEPVAPVWSPNGKRVAFADDAVYVVDADGGRLRRLSTLGQASIIFGAEVAWQPVP